MAVTDSNNGAGAVHLPLTASARHVISFLTGITCFALDTLSKSLARQHLVYGLSQPFLPHLIRFNLVLNKGAAFGVGQNSGFLVGVLAALVFAWLFLWYLKRFKGSDYQNEAQYNLVEQLSFGIILGAAFGNLFDRCLHGRVTDFLEFEFVSFPVFNIADVLIDVGIALMILSMLFKTRAKSKLAA